MKWDMCYVCMRYENTGAFDSLLLKAVELSSVQSPILYTILSTRVPSAGYNN